MADNFWRALSRLLIILVVGTLWSPCFASEANEVAVGDVASRRTVALRGKHVSFEEFHYLVFPKEGFAKDRLTIVYLPGGPGGASSNFPASIFDLQQMSGRIQYLFIDPRGTGLNLQLGLRNPEQLSTAQTVEDVTAVLRHAGLKNYVLWGGSYGTMIATQLTHHLETLSDLAQPRAVILEGTVGKANTFEEDLQGIRIGFRDFYSRMPESSMKYMARLRERYSAFPLHDILEELYVTVAYETMKSRYRQWNELVEMHLAGGWTSDDFYDHMSLEELPDWAKAFRINGRIYCDELLIVEDEKRLPTLLAAEGKNSFCRPRLNNPNLYDSARYQIRKTPVIYLQGLDDFQTPLASALHHYTSQKSLPKDSSFTLFYGIGRAVFEYELGQCLSDFIDDIKSQAYQMPRLKACAKLRKIQFKEYHAH